MVAPDSVAEPTILGVWISVKPRASSAARNPATLAAEISNPARSSGCRSVVGAWSSTVGSAAVRVGRYRSTGDGSAGGLSKVSCGSEISAPPGAWLLAITWPMAWITVSSVRSAGTATSRSTTCASPERSLMIRNVTDLSSRLRCSQPATRTCWPICEPSSLARTLIAVMRHSRDLLCPLGVRARRELAVPPHLRRGRCARTGVAASLPGHGGWPAGHVRHRWARCPFLPALGSVFATGREAAFPASGGSLRSRCPALLVSVVALAVSLPAAPGGMVLPRARCAAGRSCFLRYDLCVRQGDGTWPSLVKALVWGTREPGFKSRRPDSLSGELRGPDLATPRR